MHLVSSLTMKSFAMASSTRAFSISRPRSNGYSGTFIASAETHQGSQFGASLLEVRQSHDSVHVP